jgi:hypothetical protein
MKPTSSEPVTFDRLGLVFIQPFWWVADQPGALASLFLDLISSREGQAWFRLPDGKWVPVGDTTQDRLRNTLEDLHGLWSSGDSYNLEAFNSLREKGRCSLFMDQAGFRLRAPDLQEIQEGHFSGAGPGLDPRSGWVRDAADPLPSGYQLLAGLGALGPTRSRHGP